MTGVYVMCATALLAIGQADPANSSVEKMKAYQGILGMWESVRPDGTVNFAEVESILDGNFVLAKLGVRSADAKKINARVTHGWDKAASRYKTTVATDSGDSVEHIWNKVGDKIWVVNSPDGSFMGMLTVENDTLTWLYADNTTEVLKRVK